MRKMSLLENLPLFFIVFFLILNSSIAATAIYNVKNYGAKSNGKIDSSKAFLSAWAAACASSSPATIYVPKGSYLLKSAYFLGETCKSNAITLHIDGTILAPSDYNVIRNEENWIKFERVTGVSIYRGTLDGQGASLWACKNSSKNCPQGTMGLTFSNSSNIDISGLTSKNSQMFHILVDNCHNVKLQGVKVSAPGNSPNTDGIHVQYSSKVTIMNSHIGTGDDCISIGPGTSNLWIENIACGPGHGISIGSLGWELEEPGVQNVTVKTVAFSGTQNGLRVKTWARSSNGFVRNVLFQHIVMANVQNPIIIDQNYCPNNENCPHQGSGVKISNVKYQDIRGTSATEVAVKFDCSKKYPCSGIALEDINLSYRDQPAETSCVNAGGRASGSVKQTSCLG
ncbi:PREDICTED: polygalacturonase-like [Nicotiana attenuata]|uniref:Polygalacturonase n=1 Tax=Nicotiana attenuata TaxID=49451 RepID=A0A1J6IAF1_NICAT|nr:PREDICTED: polygalacturonase-like [Nicotiana attenuata]OIT02013.1 polygalacturonase [Nicotiana attenuata]